MSDARERWQYEPDDQDFPAASDYLPLLAIDNPHVAKDLRGVRKGRLLSPVLLVRGRLANGRPLTVADGHHRICASYHLDEDADIPCRLVDLA